MVISVLESWNKKNFSSEKNFYSSDLLRKQEKHLLKNGVQDKSEMIWDVKVEGLNNFAIHKNKIAIEVSFIARFNCIMVIIITYSELHRLITEHLSRQKKLRKKIASM